MLTNQANQVTQVTQVTQANKANQATSNDPAITDNSDFSINEWFNSIPVRIIGSHEEPFFYATDLAKVLEIKNIRTSIRNFTIADIVSMDTRKRLNLVTYSAHRGQPRENNKIILLTESGAYKLISRSKSPKAADFQIFIYNKLKEIRLAETAELKLIKEKYQSLHEHAEKINEYVRQLNDYKNLSPMIYVLSRKITVPVETIISLEKVDGYFYDEGWPEFEGKLYIYTTDLTPTEITNFKLKRKYACRVDDIFCEIDDTDSDYIGMNSKSLSTTRYVIDLPPDDLDSLRNLKVIYV